MAYIKIFPIKSTVKNVSKYICNEKKTDGQLLVTSFGCSPETADIEFAMTREMGKKNVMDKGNNLAFHLVQSFRPNEITDPKIAHEIGIKFADQFLKGKYEYIVSTHIDKGHLHNHILFNATSFIDYHKYVSNKKSYHLLCNISNNICREYGLGENYPTGERGRSYKENMEYRQGTSWKAKLKATIDKAVWSSSSYPEFLIKMKLAGYEIREGKNIAFRAPEQVNFTNMKSLGSYYTEDSVIQRIMKNKSKTRQPFAHTTEVQLFIEISTYVTTGNREAFEQWAELRNFQEAARTYNYLSQHNLLNYDNYKNHIADLNESLYTAEQQLSSLTEKIGQQKLIQKHCKNYRHCREIVENEKNSKSPKQYRAKHTAEYQLHESSKKALHDLGFTKLPNADRLQKEITDLESQQSQAEKELHSLQKQNQTLQIVKANFEKYLAHDLPDIKPNYENIL